MNLLKRLPPRLLLWLLILPVVIYILITSLRAGELTPRHSYTHGYATDAP